MRPLLFARNYYVVSDLQAAARDLAELFMPQTSNCGSLVMTNGPNPSPLSNFFVLNLAGMQKSILIANGGP
jgi:hypothetical protein